jgi:putative addiction module component (TIGR02574 family)
MANIALAELLKLSMDERLQLVEDLWDSIAAEATSQPQRLPVPEAQQLELLRRSSAYRADPSKARPLEEVLGEIERTLG